MNEELKKLQHLLGFHSNEMFGKVLIDKELASKLLLYNTNNRSISKRVVTFYANKMRAGNWVLSPDIISFSPTTLELTNGQHRLKAIVNSNVACEFYVSLEIEHAMGVDTGRKRHISDNIGLDMDCPDEIKKRNIPAIVKQAMAYCRGKCDTGLFSEELIKSVLLSYKDDLIKCYNAHLFDKSPFPGCSTKATQAAFFLAYLNGVSLDKLVRIKTVLDTGKENSPIDRPALALWEELIQLKGSGREISFKRFTLTSYCIKKVEEDRTSKTIKCDRCFYNYKLF